MTDHFTMGAAPDLTTNPEKLSDSPSWYYLLREFDTLYRHGSDGGSTAIRSHRKRVRDTLSQILDSNPVMHERTPAVKPVTAHLPRALDNGKRGALAGMSAALERISDRLTWEYGYEKVPRTLERKYAYCEVLGPQGPVLSERLIFGFVLFAPSTTYPQHSHHDIEESYISVSGAWSENQTAVYSPGSLILNSPGDEHRITTGKYEPCLLAYAWIGPSDRLAQPGMKFSRSRRKRVEHGI
ncbi:dimethylsulfonioproprionate lyase family protein [Rhodalgimonas zhirmunskyi]|uniref:Dimethylsulfoniopropionate lyase n=1 Tax=Rhodalgimonas zhirmunskyi TaxID=2964767 RepID=A0AAJ1U9F1_9RHOB|nr:dimethylsulfonioproprionate lyase family protein [Rhodoalgimonas zhirmunskyi]MDQ2095746.1 dimethylsulfoniopropionate lyase [Rhodoalgimonas zhirmunskyi]